jgi:hypothetical protein
MFLVPPHQACACRLFSKYFGIVVPTQRCRYVLHVTQPPPLLLLQLLLLPLLPRLHVLSVTR